ncbi:hypothetical protein SAMN05444365_103448 [Micromonospora pattaloongensis]|uniref:ABC-2 type transport system permease protein n=1 Tax=Micromonospora pattaloongensis TaxID=405436 RepID=A0A1H3MNF9_9ACTN|nr:hypothetical protein [Micromonospora pattaloongensis]SDY78004.1 hypothetical protein SAMN05444365_103448 [Micromonospora pattaloongensis]
MTALTRMRLAAFVRTGRAYAPLIAGLVVLGVLHGGGAAQAAEAYGVSAVVLFPVLAWQTKLLLDAEPDLQRRLALVAAGPGRELAAGLLAGALAGAATVVIGLLSPWLVGGITGPREPGDLPLGEGIALGVWAHLLALAAAVALGALASRAVTGSPRHGLVVLVGGAVAALAFGMKASVAPWAVPPLMSTARALTGAPGAGTVAMLTLHALAWAVLALAGYARLRRARR